MVKPPRESSVRRRIVTISIYALSWLALTGLMPLWLPVAAVVGLIRRRSFVVLRLLVFAWFYFGLELLALGRIGISLARLRRRPEQRAERLYALQAWWAHMVLAVARRFLDLHIIIDGAESAWPGPAILLIRHASILDTLLPCVFLQRPHKWRVRYVLKQELLFDPCIDIVGNALPNYFVDRTGNTRLELQGIRALVDDLGTDGVLLFPEGTRFSPAKQDRALARIAKETPELLDEARKLTHVLPPKRGGVLTLLDALPNVDCVFLAHTGLESFAKIKDLLSGAVVGATAHVRVWRIPASKIPVTREERMRWLYEQWGLVNAFVRSERAQD